MVRYGPLQSSMVPYGHLWSPMVPYGPVSSRIVLYGPVWSPTVTFGHQWSPMAPYCPLWSCMVTYGHLWSPLASYGPVLSCMVPCGHRLSPLVTYCHLQSTSSNHSITLLLKFPLGASAEVYNYLGKQLASHMRSFLRRGEVQIFLFVASKFLDNVPSCLCWFLIPSLAATI